ncbi:MAG: HEAT repeat domain-containing protein [Geminicoccaceae bacterium]
MPALTKALGDPDASVRQSAAQALAAIRGQQ